MEYHIQLNIRRHFNGNNHHPNGSKLRTLQFRLRMDVCISRHFNTLFYQRGDKKEQDSKQNIYNNSSRRHTN